MAAVVLAPGNLSVGPSYLWPWLAVALLLVAVLGRAHAWATWLAAAAAGGAGAFFAVVYSLDFVTGRTTIVPLALGAWIVFAVSMFQFVNWLRGARLVDPVTVVAIQLGCALTARWLFYVVSGEGLDPAGYGPDTITSPFRTELPLLALGLAAVGFGVSRPWRPTLQRLGIAVPNWWQACTALLAAGVFQLSAIPADWLTYWLMPAAYGNIVRILYISYSPLPPWAYLMFAVLAGVCEETLFRGALQPKAGIVITAALFAAIHIQYGLTPILGMVFVHGIGYGLLRRYMNTSTAIIAHATYDWSGGLVAPAVVAVAMVVVLAPTAWRHRAAIITSVFPGRGASAQGAPR